MLHRSLRPIVFVLVWFALLTSSSIVLFKTMAGPAFVTSLQAAEVVAEDADLVDPLPPGCINGTPAGSDVPTCCISGLIYFEGREVSGAEVTIADVHGIIATVQTQVYEDGLERRPYYSVDLTHLSRPVTPSQEITLTARYAGIETPPIRYRVQSGGQQVDMTIYDANVLAVKGQTQGQAEPGKFNLPYDVATDSQGNLYVIDMKNYRVQVFRPNGELIDRPKWNKGFGNLPDQFGHPQGIDIDQRTDTVYIADGRNHRVGVYTTDGELLAIWDGKNVVDNPWGAYPSDVAVAPGKHVYLVSGFAGSNPRGVYQFTLDGTFAGKLSGLKDPVGIAATPSGEIYVSDLGEDPIYKCAEDGNCTPLLVTFPAELAGSPVISSPSSIAVDTDGNLYLYDLYSDNGVSRQRLLQLADDGRVTRAWNYPQPDPLFPQAPTGLTTHGDTIYLAGYSSNQVVRLNRNGGYILPVWGGTAVNREQLFQPLGMAVNSDGSLFAAQYHIGRISHIKSDVITQSWSFTETGGTGSWGPMDLVFDNQGGLLVVDLINNALQRFTFTNTSELELDQQWTVSPGLVSRPAALAIDANDYIYIAERDLNRIQIVRITDNGLESIATFGGIGAPKGIAVDDTDPNEVLIYVADTTNHQIVRLKFTVAGRVISFFETWGKLGGDAVSCEGRNKETIEFNYPQGVAIDSSGALYVVDSRNHRVLKFDTTGQCLGRYGGLGTAPGEMWGPHGLALDNQGTLYVSDETSGRIQRFRTMEATEAPIATIVHLSAVSLTPGGTLTAIGGGQAGDGGTDAFEYIWASDQGLTRTTAQPTIDIPTVAGATLTDTLGSGLHRLQLVVRNKAGKSAPVTALVFVAQRKPEPPLIPVPTPDVNQPPPPPPTTCAPGGLWTFLLYLDADYKDKGQLNRAYQRALTQLDSLNHACIQIAIQLDGPGTGDTLRLFMKPGQPLTTSNSLTTEVGMDEAQALSAFIAWGQQELPADHYYLALANHGDGLRGTLWDHTSNPNGTAYLRVSALRDALADENVLPIDILHLDSCSMALLEVAYQLRNKVQYLIASQYLGWSFFAYGDYARYAGDYPEPDGLARQIVKRYGTLAAHRQLPATLTALDLRRIEPVKNGVDALAVRLKAWVGNDDQSRQRHHQLEAIRRQSQQFDSNLSYTNDELDAYVDLFDWLEQLREANLNSEITEATVQLLTEFPPTKTLILENHALSNSLPTHYADGQFVDLSRANGLSIYYPLEGSSRVTSAMSASGAFTYTQLFADYLDHKLFDFTSVSRWDEFLRASFDTPPADRSELEPPLPPPAPLDEFVVYLPLLMR